MDEIELKNICRKIRNATNKLEEKETFCVCCNKVYTNAYLVKHKQTNLHRQNYNRTMRELTETDDDRVPDIIMFMLLN